MALVKIILILSLSFLLGKITDRIIIILEKLTKSFKVTGFQATALIIALVTSLPELSVSISASLNGSGALALGNAIGSNIANLALVLGITAIVGKSLHFNHKEILKKNLDYLSAGFLPFVFLIDLKISAFEGFLLVIAYVWYVYNLFFKKENSDSTEEIKVEQVKDLHIKKKVWMILRMIFWIGIMLGLAQLIVLLAKQVAVELGLPILFIGLFIVSVGTSLPELIFSLELVKKRKIEMSLGNIIGSCVTNSTLIIGLLAIVRPIEISSAYVGLVAFFEYFFIAVLLVVFIKSKHRLDRYEAVVLVALFLFYSVIEIML